jgi:hypothetical protein
LRLMRPPSYRAAPQRVALPAPWSRHLRAAIDRVLPVGLAGEVSRSLLAARTFLGSDSTVAGRGGTRGAGFEPVGSGPAGPFTAAAASGLTQAVYFRASPTTPPHVRGKSSRRRWAVRRDSNPHALSGSATGSPLHVPACPGPSAAGQGVYPWAARALHQHFPPHGQSTRGPWRPVLAPGMMGHGQSP